MEIAKGSCETNIITAFDTVYYVLLIVYSTNSFKLIIINSFIIQDFWYVCTCLDSSLSEDRSLASKLFFVFIARIQTNKNTNKAFDSELINITN